MLNDCVVQGRFTSDPELKHTANGIPVLSFSLACERSFKNDAGERVVDYIDFVAWKSMAEFISTYFQKGDMILIGGSLQSRKYTTKEGYNRTSHEISVSTANFCGTRREGANDYSPRAKDVRVDNADDEDVPF